MNKGLEYYYERELAYLAELAGDFERRYPAEAGRLLPDPNRVPDPHLQRFIEGITLLCGRLHHKLDTQFPELTEALLQILAPHLVRPIPAMAIAQFELDPQNPPGPDGQTIDRGTSIFSRPVGEPPLACQFRLGYPVTLWPIQVTSAQVIRGPFTGAPKGTTGALRLQLSCQGPNSFKDLPLDRLRFFLSGEKQMIASLFETLFLHANRVVFRSLDEKAAPIEMTAQECLHQVGFNLDQGVLPVPAESFVGHRLLLEFLSFPSKFLFLDLAGWDRVRQERFGKKIEITIFLKRTQDNIEQGVNARTFLLGCSPIINLFHKSAEPIDLTQTRYEYRLVPTRNYPLGMEVFSIEEVAGIDGNMARVSEYEPFYNFGLGQSRETQKAFYFASRRASEVENDPATEVYLFLVNRDWDFHQPASEVLDVQTTCTNRNLTRFLRGGDVFSLEGGLRQGVGAIRCLQAPTAPLRPPLRRAAHWRLLAQLSLHHKTLTDPQEGLVCLQEMLRLCDFTESEVGSQLSAVNRQVIEGMIALRSKRVLGKVAGSKAVGFCRGLEFALELDEKKYVGVGVYLFASVLERFLGLYANLNSFSQLALYTLQGDLIQRWPPRSMETQLL